MPSTKGADTRGAPLSDRAGYADTGGHPGWRRTWQVVRVLLVATAAVVVGGNLVRGLAVQPAGGAAPAVHDATANPGRPAPSAAVHDAPTR
ncbi:MAG TPA: hypothetical protein VEB22_09590 [Phycisphaerales bacterium]|nr:hypothetical protein [Phycisphaerales bacterium]